MTVGEGAAENLLVASRFDERSFLASSPIWRGSLQLPEEHEVAIAAIGVRPRLTIASMSPSVAPVMQLLRRAVPSHRRLWPLIGGTMQTVKSPFPIGGLR